MSSTRPITVLIGALGGEGGGVLTDWLVQAARLAKLPMQATSVPGVAQRTGATTYYLECLVASDDPDAPQSPVFGLSPLPGHIDLLVSSELLETTRQVALGLPSADRTLVITSTARALTVAERMRPADGRMDSEALLAVVQQHARTLHAIDFARLARESHTVVSAVLLGAIAASGVLPLGRPHFEAAIRAGRSDDHPAVAANLAGFARGWASLSNPQEAHQPARVPDEHGASVVLAFQSLFDDTAERIRAYQNERYAQCFRERVQRVMSAEHLSPQAAALGYKITPQLMPWLALWMMHEDVAEVARLKSRRERWQRIAHEVKHQPGQLLQVEEFLKPGVPELTALLPRWLARPWLSWDERRQRRGLPAWSMPLRLKTHTVSGMVALRLLAALRLIRPWGHEHRRVQADIDAWLAALLRVLPESAELALEIARLGQLIKGYGQTHAHSLHTFHHLLTQVALDDSRSPAQRAQALRDAIQAAGAQSGTAALNQSLAQHQAPTLSPPPQPIRWMARRPSP
jgi:indolepyruvate ferredoxin oxidoreductase beta subunit